MQYDISVLCNGIFEVDEKIRFVGIIDQMGKLVVGDMKKGLPSLERDDGSIRLYLGYAINNMLRRDFDNVFGKVLYTFSEREKIKLLTVPMDNYLLLVSIDKLSDHVKLINKIMDVVKKLTMPWSDIPRRVILFALMFNISTSDKKKITILLETLTK